MLQNFWGLKQIETAIHRSKYKTRPFEAALQDAFGQDQALFGGQYVESFMNKVAVTSTTEVDQQQVVLANYNREEQQGFGTILAPLIFRILISVIKKG